MAGDVGRADIDLGYITKPSERLALERYDTVFCRALLDLLPSFAEPLTLLDLAAGDGLVAFAVAAKLAAGSRLMVLADESLSLERLHAYATTALAPGLLGNTVFPRREDLTRLPFGSGVFDIVYACLPMGDLPEPRTVFAQALRVLRPGGLIALSVVLPQSLIELARAVAQAELAEAGEHTAAIVSQRLAARIQLPTLSDWQGLLSRAGAVDVVAREQRFDLVAEPDAHRDELYSTRLVPLLLGTTHEHATLARRLLKTAVRQPLTTTVSIGALSGRKPTAPQ